MWAQWIETESMDQWYDSFSFKYFLLVTFFWSKTIGNKKKVIDPSSSSSSLRWRSMTMLMVNHVLMLKRAPEGIENDDVLVVEYEFIPFLSHNKMVTPMISNHGFVTNWLWLMCHHGFHSLKQSSNGKLRIGWWQLSSSPWIFTNFDSCCVVNIFVFFTNGKWSYVIHWFGTKRA